MRYERLDAFVEVSTITVYHFLSLDFVKVDFPSFYKCGSLFLYFLPISDTLFSSKNYSPRAYKIKDLLVDPRWLIAFFNIHFCLVRLGVGTERRIHYQPIIPEMGVLRIELQGHDPKITCFLKVQERRITVN